VIIKKIKISGWVKKKIKKVKKKRWTFLLHSRQIFFFIEENCLKKRKEAKSLPQWGKNICLIVAIMKSVLPQWSKNLASLWQNICLFSLEAIFLNEASDLHNGLLIIQLRRMFKTFTQTNISHSSEILPKYFITWALYKD